MQIPDPPDQRGCVACDAALTWLFSPARNAWICVVAINRRQFVLHGCRDAQDLQAWRDMQRQPAPQQRAINAAGRQRVAAAVRKERTEEDA